MNKVKIEVTHSKQVLQEKILKDKHKKKKRERSRSGVLELNIKEKSRLKPKS